jgi:hypothetical protein
VKWPFSAHSKKRKKPPEQVYLRLKIRVSLVRFRPWAPFPFSLFRSTVTALASLVAMSRVCTRDAQDGAAILVWISCA